MKNADMPAMPQTITDSNDNSGLVGSHMEEEWQGLTKREMFAMNALPSVINWLDSGVDRGEWDDWSFEDAASHAVIAADALLKELEK